jgi:hypothetical protein
MQYEGRHDNTERKERGSTVLYKEGDMCVENTVEENTGYVVFKSNIHGSAGK